MKKRILVFAIMIGIITLIVTSYPVAKLALTDSKVSKSLLSNTYYIKIEIYENEYIVFSEYMESLGWKENLEKQMGAGHIFIKNGVSKHISNRNIKTAIIDGKLNLYFINRWKK